MLKNVERLAHRQVEHLVDVLAAVLDLEHLRLEPLAVALVARHEHVGEELHLDADLALALARLAAAARHVEREVARGEAARLRASFVAANSSRIGSNALRYVTGLLRGVRPIGVWSTSTASVMNSMPSIDLNAPTPPLPVALGALDAPRR